MRLETKKTITAILGNLLFIPPIVVIYKEGNINWFEFFYSTIPLIVTMIFLRLIWGPDIFSKAAWQKENFTSYSDWYKNSQSFFARMSRFNMRVALRIIFIVVPIIVAIYLIVTIYL